MSSPNDKENTDPSKANSEDDKRDEKAASKGVSPALVGGKHKTKKKGVAQRLGPKAKGKKQDEEASNEGKSQADTERSDDGGATEEKARRKSSVVKKPETGWNSPFIQR